MADYSFIQDGDFHLYGTKTLYDCGTVSEFVGQQVGDDYIVDAGRAYLWNQTVGITVDRTVGDKAFCMATDGVWIMDLGGDFDRGDVVYWGPTSATAENRTFVTEASATTAGDYVGIGTVCTKESPLAFGEGFYGVAINIVGNKVYTKSASE